MILSANLRQFEVKSKHLIVQAAIPASLGICNLILLDKYVDKFAEIWLFFTQTLHEQQKHVMYGHNCPSPPGIWLILQMPQDRLF